VTFSPNTEIQQILNQAKNIINRLNKHTLDVLTINRPSDAIYASNVAKYLSKLSPLVANDLEFTITRHLNQSQHWANGQWVRQDPNFPDIT